MTLLMLPASTVARLMVEARRALEAREWEGSPPPLWARRGVGSHDSLVGCRVCRLNLISGRKRDQGVRQLRHRWGSTINYTKSDRRTATVDSARQTTKAKAKHRSAHSAHTKQTLHVELYWHAVRVPRASLYFPLA